MVILVIFSASACHAGLKAPVSVQADGKDEGWAGSPHRAHHLRSPTRALPAAGHPFVLRIGVRRSKFTPVAKLWNSSREWRIFHLQGLDSGDFF